MNACRNGHKDVVQLLLDNSEEIELNVCNIAGITAFMWACQNGHKDVVQLFLDYPERVEVNAINVFGETAFMLACRKGHKDVVKLLLDHSDIYLNIRDSEERTALMIAEESGHQDIVQMLDQAQVQATYQVIHFLFSVLVFIFYITPLAVLVFGVLAQFLVGILNNVD